jgi:hypothetical protein
MAEETLDNTLTEAISKAVETHEDDKPGDAEVVDKEDTKEGDDKEDGKEGKDKDEADEEIVNGRILYRALKDPAKAGAVIDFLATQAGYSKANVQTKTDVKEATKDLTGILERNLGEEFKFLAPKLAPAIKESIEELMEEHNKDIRTRLDDRELKDIQEETARTHTDLANEWFGSDLMPDKVVKAMSSAMDEFPPTDPKMSAERYYRRIFTLVVGELGLQKEGGTRSDKASRNRKDDIARNLASQNRGVTPSTNGNVKKMSLNDAVSAAIKEVANKK